MNRKLIIIFLLFVQLAFSQEEKNATAEKKSYNFSLAEAIEHAKEHNYSEINAVRDINAAKQKKWETTAAGLPQINASASLQDNFVLQKSIIPAEFFGGTPGEFVTVAFGTKFNMLGQATVSQLIFDGSYIVGLQAAKTYLEFYDNAKQKTDLEIKELIIKSYGNVLLAGESVNIVERNIASLTKTLNDTRETYNNGLIEEEGVEQMQITLASLETNLNYTKRQLDIALKMLKIQLGLEINDELTLKDKLEDLTLERISISNEISFDVNNNINFKLATNLQKQRMLELKLERSRALPSLSANFNYGYNAFNDQFVFFSGSQNWMNFSNLGVGLNIPIFSSFKRNSRTQQAKIALEQAKTKFKETEQQVLLQFAAAKSEYEYSIADYGTAKTNLNLAERIEKKQQVKFAEGISTSFEFNEAQRQLYTAQQRYLQSMVNIINNKAALEKITSK